VGKWIAIIAVILRLFFPRHFPGTSPAYWFQPIKFPDIGFTYILLTFCGFALQIK
jgi:hypothetical protein